MGAKFTKKIFISKNNKEDKKISLFVISFYYIQALNIILKITLPISDTLWKTMSNGFMLLLFILMILTIVPVLKRNLISFMLMEFIFLILYLISFLQGNANLTLLLDTGFWTLGVCIPLAIYVYSVKNKEIFYNAFLNNSYILTIMLSLALFIMANNSGDLYSMSLSYSLVIPLLFQINEFFRKRCPINLVVFCFATIAIILYGARGPLLCLIFFLLLKYSLGKYSIMTKIVIFVLVCVCIILFVIYSERIIASFALFLNSRGIYSRTVRMLLNGHILNNSGRNMLFDYYWGLIQEKPIFGWGLMGGWIKAGNGPHNMLLEFLLAFGFIGGGILCLIAISFIFRVFFIKNKVLKDLLMIYCAANVTMFIVSGNFLEKYDWFIFIALCLTSDNKKAKKEVPHFCNERMIKNE